MWRLVLPVLLHAQRRRGLVQEARSALEVRGDHACLACTGTSNAFHSIGRSQVFVFQALVLVDPVIAALSLAPAMSMSHLACNSEWRPLAFADDVGLVARRPASMMPSRCGKDF